MQFLNPENQLFFISSFVLFAFSAFSFSKGAEKRALLLLFLAAFVLRLCMISLDPFLNKWDERFHALVAKNMMDHPFKPMLRVNTTLPVNYYDWTGNHIWLHKQPFFLWQMALSMKIFGVNEFAVRFPGALMGAIQIIFIYRIGKLVLNKQTGYIAALLFAGSYFQLQQTSGLIGMDQNDIAFAFYTIASIWALAEYNFTYKKYWVVLIGIFSGIAILNKWLTGLLVYACWGIIILADKESRRDFKQYLYVFYSFLITCIVFLPWQFYISKTFPVESTIEYQFNNLHFGTALEGHTGTYAFYINRFTKEHFGYWAIFPFILGIYYIIKQGKSHTNKLLILIPVCIIYIFFSFFVASKTSAYVFVVASLIYILLAAGLVFISEIIPSFRMKKFVTIGGFVILFLVNLSPAKILFTHFESAADRDREAKINNTEIYKQLNELVPEGYFVFNVPELEHADAMFYSERNVYHWWPTESEYHVLKEEGIHLAAFPPHHKLPVPDYIKNDRDILWIEKNLK